MNNIIKDYIYSIDIPIDTSVRLDCPICSGTKTLSVTKFTDCTKYYCFHANCTKGGVIKEGLNITSFNTPTIQDNGDTPNKLQEDKQHWRRGMYTTEFCNYILDNRCDYAMSNKLADIRHDYKQDRVVFVIKENNKVVDAAGRYIGKNAGFVPKWYRYGDSGTPFICGTSSHAIVVEDCASACSVSSFSTGVALLGTSLSEKVLDILSDFDTVTVALDKDATTKSIDMVMRLNWELDNVNMVVLERDLKKLDVKESKKVLKIDD